MRKPILTSCLAFLVAAACFRTASAQAPPANGYAISRIPVEPTNPAVAVWYSVIDGLTSDGQVFGETIFYGNQPPVLSPWLGRESWAYSTAGGYRVLNLGGAEYEATINGTSARSGSINFFTSAGLAVGPSTRFGGGNPSITLGTDTWFNTGFGASFAINPTGPGYEYLTPNGVHREATVTALTDAGRAVGYSRRFGADGALLGSDVWAYDGTSGTRVLGLTGAEYEYATPSGTYRASGSDAGVNTAGVVAGSTGRYSATGGDLGYDAWVAGATGPVRNISLLGPDVEEVLPDGVRRRSRPQVLSGSGVVAGRAGRMGLNVGHDGWVWRGDGPSRRVGLLGFEYELPLVGGGVARDAWVAAANATGQVVGSSQIYTNHTLTGYQARDIWLANPGQDAIRVSPVGPGYEADSGNRTVRRDAGYSADLTERGQVVGSIRRLTATNEDRGTDTWYYDDAGGTRIINLTGPDYEAPRSDGVPYRAGRGSVTASGQVLGYSARYSSLGNSLGRDVWLYTGSASSRIINPTGGAFEFPRDNGVYRYGISEAINRAGDVVGTSKLYNSAGTETGRLGWFYDHQTGTTSTFPGIPLALTDEGVVLGYYPIASTAYTSFGFWWSRDAGFHDLGELVSGGLSVNGWSRITFDTFPTGARNAGVAPGGGPLYITSEGSLLSGAGALYLLTSQIPEPLSAGALAAMGLVAVRRRRRVGAPEGASTFETTGISGNCVGVARNSIPPDRAPCRSSPPDSTCPDREG